MNVEWHVLQLFLPFCCLGFLHDQEPRKRRWIRTVLHMYWRWMRMREMRGCEGDGWEIALSDARELETIMKVLADGEGDIVIMC